MSNPGLEQIDIREIARTAGGEMVATDRRLYMQFFAFGGCSAVSPLVDAQRTMFA